MSLESLLKFHDLLLQFQEVERVVSIRGRSHPENDVEHSYQLAMIAWYIAESDQLELDKDLLIKYSLVHDLVEAYAGDTYFYTSEEERAKKIEREAESAKRIKKEFSEFGSLNELIEKYEKREDKESKFVHALDKLLPMINMYKEGGSLWKDRGVTVDMQMEKKGTILKKIPELEPYFTELIEVLKSKPELFAKS